jgi:hypothetical protein
MDNTCLLTGQVIVGRTRVACRQRCRGFVYLVLSLGQPLGSLDAAKNDKRGCHLESRSTGELCQLERPDAHREVAPDKRQDGHSMMAKTMILSESRFHIPALYTSVISRSQEMRIYRLLRPCSSKATTS